MVGGSSTPQGLQRIAPKRHFDGANAVFLDGHAEYLKSDKLLNLERWDDGDYHRPPWQELPPT